MFRGMESLEARQLFAFTVSAISAGGSICVLQVDGTAGGEAVTVNLRPDTGGDGFSDVFIDVGAGFVNWSKPNGEDPFLINVHGYGGNDEINIHTDDVGGFNTKI